MSNNTMMEQFDKQAELQKRAQEMIANEFNTRTLPKDLLGENFEKLKTKVLKFATPLSMQISLEKFMETKKRLREKTIAHEYTLAEVGGVTNSFENSANELNLEGGEEEWDELARIALPLSDIIISQLEVIQVEVKETLTAGMQATKTKGEA